MTYLCDHPAQHRDRLKKLDEDAVVFVCDLLYIPYIRKYDVVLPEVIMNLKSYMKKL